MDIVVDVELFAGGVVKELAFCSGTFHAGYLFKPPKSFNKLTKDEQDKNKWLTKYCHQIPWSFGEYEYTELPLIIRLFSRPEASFHAKGQVTCDFSCIFVWKKFQKLGGF